MADLTEIRPLDGILQALGTPIPHMASSEAHKGGGWMKDKSLSPFIWLPSNSFVHGKQTLKATEREQKKTCFTARAASGGMHAQDTAWLKASHSSGSKGQCVQVLWATLGHVAAPYTDRM